MRVGLSLGGVEGFETNKGLGWCSSLQMAGASYARRHARALPQTQTHSVCQSGHANREGEHRIELERRSPPREPATEDAPKRFPGFPQPHTSILGLAPCGPRRHLARNVPILFQRAPS